MKTQKVLATLFVAVLIGVTSSESSSSGDTFSLETTSPTQTTGTAIDSTTRPSTSSNNEGSAPISSGPSSELLDDFPNTFQVVVGSKTEAPATTPPPFSSSKPARTVRLVTSGTPSPTAATPTGTLSNPDSGALAKSSGRTGFMPVAAPATTPAETHRLVTRSSASPTATASTKTPSNPNAIVSGYTQVDTAGPPATTTPSIPSSKPARTFHRATGTTASPPALQSPTTSSTDVTKVGPATSTETAVASPSDPVNLASIHSAAVTSKSSSSFGSSSTMSTQDNFASGTPKSTMSTDNAGLPIISASDGIRSAPTRYSAAIAPSAGTKSTLPNGSSQEDTLDSSTSINEQQNRSTSTTTTTEVIPASTSEDTFRDVVTSTTIKSPDSSDRVGNEAVSLNESVLNVMVDSRNSSSGSSDGTNAEETSTDGSIKLSTPSAETANEVGSEGDAQQNRLETNAGFRAAAAMLSILIVVAHAAL